MASRIGPIATLPLVWPLALPYAVLKVPSWIMLDLYAPDVVIWLQSVVAVVFFKGLIEIALAWRVFLQIH
jgi:hypothetical protein